MAIRFGDAVKGFKEGQEFREQKKNNSIDALVKQAQLQELGYNIQQVPRQGLFGGGQMAISRDPNFVGEKQLAREKTGLEVQKLQQEMDMRKQGMQRFGTGGAGASSSGIVPKDFDEFGVPKSYYDPKAEMERERQKDAAKPLTGDTANKYSGAKQGIGNIQQIMDALQLQQDPMGKVSAGEKFGDVSKKFKNYAVASKMGGAGLTIPNVLTGGLYGKLLGADVSPEIKNLATSYKLLIENQLRARSGAAVPEQEVQREFDRTAMDFFADPESVYNKLNEANTYLSGTAEEIRPGQTPKLNTGSRFGQPDLLEEEAQAAIANGADPKMVQQRLQQLRSQRG